MARVHCLQHVESFFAATFSNDDSVGTHSKRILYEFALSDLALAFCVGRPGFQAAHVRLLQLEFGRIFDRDQALVGWNIVRQCVEHRGFAAAGTTGNYNRHFPAHRGSQRVDHWGLDRPNFSQRIHRKWPFGKLAD